MERSDQILRIGRIAVLALTLLATVMRTLALCLAFDADPGYFKAGAALPILYYIIMVASAVAFCALPFLVRGRATVPAEPPMSLARLVAAGVLALLLALNCMYLLANSTELAAPSVIATFAAIFLAVGVAYFVLHFFGERYRSARVLCGYGIILAAVLLLSITYFDRYTPMNAPHKVGLHLVMLAIMASMLYELRAAIGGNKPRALAVTSLLALLITATVGVSNVITYLAGVYTDTTYLMQDLLAVGYALWVGTRIFADGKAPVAESENAA